MKKQNKLRKYLEENRKRSERVRKIRKGRLENTAKRNRKRKKMCACIKRKITRIKTENRSTKQERKVGVKANIKKTVIKTRVVRCLFVSRSGVHTSSEATQHVGLQHLERTTHATLGTQHTHTQNESWDLKKIQTQNTTDS